MTLGIVRTWCSQEDNLPCNVVLLNGRLYGYCNCHAYKAIVSSLPENTVQVSPDIPMRLCPQA